MGNDGGSIARRDELVKVKTTSSKADVAQLRQAKWTLCHLSRQPLRQPIVADGLGRLYNKEAIVKWLLDIKSGASDSNRRGEEKGSAMAHIRGLKDVTLLKLHAASGAKSAATAATSEGSSPVHSKFSCPLTGRPMNGSHRFVYILTSGAVMSEAGLKAIIAETSTSAKSQAARNAPGSEAASRDSPDTPSSSSTPGPPTKFECPITSLPFSPGSLITKHGAAAQDVETVGDVILLNPPSEQEEEVLRAAMYRRRGGEATGEKKRKKKDKSLGDSPLGHPNGNSQSLGGGGNGHPSDASSTVAPVDRKKQKRLNSPSHVQDVEEQRPSTPTSAVHLANMAARQAKNKPMSAALASIYGHGIPKGEREKEGWMVRGTGLGR